MKRMIKFVYGLLNFNKQVFFVIYSTLIIKVKETVVLVWFFPPPRKQAFKLCLTAANNGSVPSCISTIFTIGLMSHSGLLCTSVSHTTIADTGGQ